MTQQNTCARCAFFRKTDGAGDQVSGQCLRNPPTPMLMPSPSGLQSNAVGMGAVNPPVSPDHWCGEFKPAQGLQSAD